MEVTHKVINLIYGSEAFRGTWNECLDYCRELVGDSMAALLLEVVPI